MKTAPASQDYCSGQPVFLDSLTEGGLVSEGELNVFLVRCMESGQAGEHFFLTALPAGKSFFPEAPLLHKGIKYRLAVVPCGNTRVQPLPLGPFPELSNEELQKKEWLACLYAAVHGSANVEPEHASISTVLAALMDARDGQKQQRQEKSRENDRLTRTALSRTLDTLGGIAGIHTPGQTLEKGADPLEQALRKIAQCYRLPFNNTQAGAAQGSAVHEPQEEIAPQDRLKAFVETAGWRMRNIVLPPDFYTHSARPVLAFRRDDNAPLVLFLNANGSSYWDPAQGEAPRRLTAAVAKGISTEAYCFYEPFPTGPKTQRAMLRFIFANAGPTLGIMLLAGLVSALIGLVMPVATHYVTGKIIPTANLHELWQLAFLLVTLTTCQIALSVVPTLVTMLFGAQQFERFEAAMFDHILRIPVATFHICDAGDMTQRIMGASQVQSAVFSIISGQFLGAVFSLVSLSMMFYYSPTLALVGSGAVILYALLFFFLSRINLQPLARHVAASGRISGLLKQFFDGMAKIRGAGAEQRVLSRFMDDFSELARTDFIIARNGSILSLVGTIFPAMISVLFYALAGGFLVRNLPLPVFLAFMAAFQNFQGSLMGVSSGCWALLAVGPEINRLKPLLEAEPEDTGERHPPRKLSGQVEVSHLRFRYAPDAPLVLDDVSFAVAPGEFIAIVGPSGSGKSSLVRLLLGFEQPEGGSIYYSGKDLANLELRAVRRQLGVILQHSKILPGSILENITTGTEHTLPDAWRALQLAAFDKEVEAMPMGIHTLVSSETLSGGEQQRILIARALVGTPTIVVMDESTSALDNRTQEYVTNSMAALRMTRIVIAHRLSTIIRADRIYVLEKGRILQSGSYAELSTADGLFKRLVERQRTGDF